MDEPMMWVLIFSELAVFGLLLCAFAVAGAVSPTTFAAGREVLDSGSAGLNTVVLVTSGWGAARGALASREGRRRACRAWLTIAILLGGLFVAIKLFEYSGEIAAGVELETNTFFTLYFLLTGFHVLHVLLGMIILGTVLWSADVHAVETGTSFWHMVDLVWVTMFPVIYLAR